jgi:hypothetical protein
LAPGNHLAPGSRLSWARGHDASAREQWFAEVLQVAIDTRILSEQRSRPRDPVGVDGSVAARGDGRVIEATLASGSMSHKAIVEIVTLELLAEKVPASVVWACLAAAAERSGIRDAIPRKVLAREFFAARARCSPQARRGDAPEVVQHINAQVLGTSLPETLTTKLLEVTLAAGKMTPGSSSGRSVSRRS